MRASAQEKDAHTAVTCYRCRKRAYGRDLADIPYRVRIVKGRPVLVCEECDKTWQSHSQS